MEINLIKAEQKDAVLMHELQIKSFRDLLLKYQDYDISPGNETLERVENKILQSNSKFYFICFNQERVGGVRIVEIQELEKIRISPIFISPSYRNIGIAQHAMHLLEKMFNPLNGWILDTILEEKGNCYLYEKLGYVKTGKFERIKENMNIVYYEKKL